MIQKNTAILISIFVIIALILIYYYHTLTFRRWYWQAKIFGESNAIAVVFSKPYFKGEQYVITLPEGAGVDQISDLSEDIVLPFEPKSIVSSPIYNISVNLSETYEYHPPSRCLNFIDEDICLGSVSSLQITKNI